jgi:hypothetical protein
MKFPVFLFAVISGGLSLPAFGQGTASLTDTASPAAAPSSLQAVASAPAPSYANAEQGQYTRRSVSHLGSLWLRGKAQTLSPVFLGYLMNEMQQEFHLPRFDDNPLPESFLREFTAAANGQPNLTDEELGRIIEATLVPKIVEVVKLQSIARASGLRTSQQMNSLISDKTKTMDITGEQVLSIMNSAWLYVPVVNEVTILPQRQDVMATVSMSLLWYHIRVDAQGEPHVELAKVLNASGVMTARRSQGVFSNAETFCFRSAAQTCVRQLLKETKEIPDFSLSGQVVETSIQSVGIDIGTREGAAPNDQYYLVENVEGKDGSTQAQNVGWIRISGREDSLAKRPTSARILSGSPYAGLALKEIALSSWSIEAGYLGEAMKLDDTSGLLNGFQVGAFYTPHLWYGLSAGVEFQFLAGSLSSTDLTIMGGRFALRQTIPLYRRLSLFVEPEISYRNISTGGDTANDVQAVQFGVSGGLELAILPSLTLRGGAGYSSFSADVTTNSCDGWYGCGSNTVRLESDGVKFGVQLQWTPPTLGFNPLDLFLGQMGM